MHYRATYECNQPFKCDYATMKDMLVQIANYYTVWRREGHRFRIFLEEVNATDVSIRTIGEIRYGR